MRKPLLLLTAVIVLVAGLWAMRVLQQPPPPQFAPSLGGPAAAAVGEEPRQPGTGGTLPAFLPPEAHDTIALILREGPFPHRQDGSVFGNRERRLPQRPRGYYREYTVRTPDLGHRGARRIVTGGDPPEAWYYTDDHYETFRGFEVPADGGTR